MNEMQLVSLTDADKIKALYEVWNKHSLKVLNAETDDDSVLFYQRMGFEVTKKSKIYKDCKIVS